MTILRFSEPSYKCKHKTTVLVRYPLVMAAEAGLGAGWRVGDGAIER